MNVVKIAVGLVPFLVFSLLAPVLGAGWSAGAGFAAALAVAAGTARGGLKVLPCAQALILLAATILGVAGDAAVDETLVRFGPAAAAFLLGLVMLGSAAVSRPFTAQLARAGVPREVWHNAGFISVNRRISTAWGLAVLTLGLSHVVGAQLRAETWPLPERVALVWVVPLIGFALATNYTKSTVRTATPQLKEPAS